MKLRGVNREEVIYRRLLTLQKEFKMQLGMKSTEWL